VILNFDPFITRSDINDVFGVPWHSETPEFFSKPAAGGMGMIALWNLMSAEGRAGTAEVKLNPLQAKPPQFAPKAKSVIWLFMSGGPKPARPFREQTRAKEVARRGSP